MEEVLRLGMVLIALAAFHPLHACSVPQPPDAPTQSPSVATLIEDGHYRRASATLESKPLAADASAHEIAQHAYLESRVALGLGQYDLALQLAEKAVAAEPPVAAYHLQVAAAAGHIAQHAGLLKQLSLAKRVKKELDDAIALEPKRPDSIYGLMTFYQLAPAMVGGDKSAAQKLAEDLTVLDPARGYLAQATLAKDRNDTATEGALIRKAVAANPDSYPAHMALANFLKRMSPIDSDAVDEQTCLALLIDPARSEAWQSLAESAVAAECWQEVTGLIQTAERFVPDDDSPAYAAAVAMVASGKNLAQAQTLLTHYLETVPEGEAPSPSRANYQLALLSEKRAQPQDALFHLHAAIDEDSTNEDARKELKRLSHETPHVNP